MLREDGGADEARRQDVRREARAREGGLDDASDEGAVKVRKRLRGNDGGGSIFSSLEMAKTLDEITFTRLFKTPQQVDLWHLAQAYGWAYARVDTLGQLDEALTKLGRILIDVRL